MRLSVYTIFFVFLPFLTFINVKISSLFVYFIYFLLLIACSDLKFNINTKPFVGTIFCILLMFITIITALIQYIALYDIYIYGMRFFGFFTISTFLFLNSISFKNFISRYLEIFLTYYVIVFSFWLLYDAYVLYIVKDITLQLMYDPEAYSYVDRPFGPTGQPSVNSVLLCFLLMFRRSLGKKFTPLDLLALVAVFLQASGSGAIALLMYLYFIIKIRNINSISVLIVLSIIIFMSVLLDYHNLEFQIFGKISEAYIVAMIEVFKIQVHDWLNHINYSPVIILFGGGPSAIDFGPLYFLSSTGLFYLIFYAFFIIFILINCRQKMLRQSLYILLVGNMHYPVIFYSMTTIILSIYYVISLVELKR